MDRPFIPTISQLNTSMSLPAEIWAEVLSYVSHPSDRHSLLLVSNLLRIESERVIYKDVSLSIQSSNATDPDYAAIEHIANCERVARHIQSLTLCSGKTSEGTSSGLEEGFQTLRSSEDVFDIFITTPGLALQRFRSDIDLSLSLARFVRSQQSSLRRLELSFAEDIMYISSAYNMASTTSSLTTLVTNNLRLFLPLSSSITHLRLTYSWRGFTMDPNPLAALKSLSIEQVLETLDLYLLESRFPNLTYLEVCFQDWVHGFIRFSLFVAHLLFKPSLFANILKQCLNLRKLKVLLYRSQLGYDYYRREHHHRIVQATTEATPQLMSIDVAAPGAHMYHLINVRHGLWDGETV